MSIACRSAAHRSVVAARRPDWPMLDVMAELTHKERLQPSLLDRLTDDEPDDDRVARERVLSPSAPARERAARSRLAVQHRPTWRRCKICERHPEVGALGAQLRHCPTSPGARPAGLDVADLERCLRQAIWDFEPRLLRKHACKVRARSSTETR